MKISPSLTGSRGGFEDGISFLRRTFLPVRTPRDGYIEYQICDLIQGLSSYLRSQLAIEATLEGLGVGSAERTVTSGALAWILRDGAALAGGLIFCSLAAHDFGRHTRQWRLFADVINDVGLTLQMVAPMFGARYFAYISASSAICTAMCGASAGATKAQISQHFAQDAADLADLVAKEGTQETFVNILGLVLGFSMVSSDIGIVGKCACFVILTIVHLWANWKAVSFLEFRHLNDVRLGITLDTLLNEGWVPGPKDVAKEEPMLIPAKNLYTLGVKVKAATVDATFQPRYALLDQTSGTLVDAVLHVDATLSDIAEAAIAAHLAARGDERFVAAQVLDRLQKKGWRLQSSLDIGDLGFRSKFDN
eukprot:g1921.t1